jgi:hypothetical protein
MAEALVGKAMMIVDELQLSEAGMELIEDAAVLTALGRAAIPRDYRREIDGEPDIEEPTRVAKQLTMLARCLLALGLTETEAVSMACRVGLDSMPSIRARTLIAITEAEGKVDTAKVADSLEVAWKTVSRAREDLQCLGLVCFLPLDAAAAWDAAGSDVGAASPNPIGLMKHESLVRSVIEARNTPILEDFPGQT